MARSFEQRSIEIVAMLRSGGKVNVATQHPDQVIAYLREAGATDDDFTRVRWEAMPVRGHVGTLQEPSRHVVPLGRTKGGLEVLTAADHKRARKAAKRLAGRTP